MTDKENRLADMVARQFAEMVATGGSGGGGGDNPFVPSSGYKEVTLRSGFGYTRTTLRSGCVSSWSMGFPIYTDDATIAVGDKVIVKGTATDDGTPFAVWGEVNSVRERSGYYSLIITVEGSSIREDSASVVDVNSNGQTLIFGATEVHVAVPPYGEGNMDISANGPYNVSGKASVIVDVPNSYGAADEGKVVSSGALVSQTTQNISANGTYNTTEKNEVVVNVPNSYGAADEGKVVSSGALVSQTTKTVTENGTVDTTSVKTVTVNVPNPSTGTKEITANGTHDVKDYASASVAVPPYGEGSVEITANGTHNVSGKASASVAVPPYGEGSVEITANGTHNVSGKASAVVNVPNSYSQIDEGKVVSSGALVAQTTQTITANGTYDTTSKKTVTVNVPNPSTGTKEITANGTHDVTAYASASVAVPPYGEGSVEITANGTHNVSGKASAVVNVPNSYTASDEGKVVSSGALVAQTSKTVTANGTVDTTQNNEVVVNVPDYTKLARVFRAGQSSGSIDITDDDIPSAITGLTAYAFYRKSTLRSFVSTAQIKAVENFAFQAASGLRTVELLQIGSIGGSTFNNCTALTTARFGNITSIGTSAFYGCTALQDLFIDCENVPTLASTNAFTNVPSTCNIWVPDDLVDSFKAANNWSSFASQIKPVSEYEGE